MKKLIFNSISLTLCLSIVLWSFQSFANSTNLKIDWSEKARVNVRGLGVKSCQVALAPIENGKQNDMQGTLLSTSNRVEDFKAVLPNILNEKGREALRGVLYVGGVDLQAEAKVQKEYETILREAGIDSSHTKVTVFSVPKKATIQSMRNLAGHWTDRFRDLMFSKHKDLVTPQSDEIKNGIITNTAVEVFNYLAVGSVMTGVDAGLTIALHATVLGSYIVWTQSMTNWYMRHHPSYAAAFLKTMVTSAPFIAIYGTASRFTPILNYVQTHSLEDIKWRVLSESGALGLHMIGLTGLLQTFFYMSLNNVVGNWVESKSGADKDTARAAAPWIKAPFQLPDAVLLTMASANTPVPFTNIPNFVFYPNPIADVTLAHAGLAALGLGVFVMKYKPDLLDPTLRWYRAYEKAKKRFWDEGLTVPHYGLPPDSY
ncbi:MAG: hypothetical protein AB7F59_14725 [Bdellovibrionales bacterium]